MTTRAFLSLLFILCFLSVSVCSFKYHEWKDSQDDYEERAYRGDDDEEEKRSDLDFALYKLVGDLESLTGMKSFYELFEIPITATANQITSAYRKKSIMLHPDRNRDNPKADDIFAILASAAKVLRNEEQRTRYNWILTEAPVWHKVNGYYMKKFFTAKMSIMQVLLAVIIFVTLAQLVIEVIRWSRQVGWKWWAHRNMAALGRNESKRLKRKLEQAVDRDFLMTSPEYEDYVAANTDVDPIQLRKLYVWRAVSSPFRLFRSSAVKAKPQ